MTLQLPYSGIGDKLPDDPNERATELQRRLEAIEGNFNELTGIVDKPTFNRRSTITTAESSSSASYTTLTTPDQVGNVWLPENGLLGVLFHASFKSSVAGAGRAAVFLNGTQLVKPNAAVQEARSHALLTNTYQLVGTYSAGLTCYEQMGTVVAPPAYTGDVTTGQVAGGPRADWYYKDSFDGLGGTPFTEALDDNGGGGPCFILAAAGTYTIDVRFKATSGSVTVQNRRLWVWPMNF